MPEIGEALKNGWKAVVAEFIGSLLLVFCGTVMFGDSDSDITLKIGAAARDGRLFMSFGDTGLRFGMTLAALAVALGPVSGAHFNPVVSMAALINGRIEWLVCLLYILSQLLGSVAGAFFAWSVGGSGLTLPGGLRYPVGKALGVEVLITALLVLVFLAATDPERGDALKDLAGIAVGLALAVGHWVGIPFSGGSMNPWRTLASAITRNYWDDIWIYFAGPPVGALLSAVVYKFVLSGAKESSL